MPTLAELEALVGEAAAPPPTGTAIPDVGVFGALGNVATGAFETGKGGLFALLDFLDRPGRAARHAFTGDWRQALEAFDPGNLLTPGTESRPISGAEVLARWGVEEGPSARIPLLGDVSTRDVGGFGLALLLDPFTYFGAPVGAFAQKGLTRAGQAARAGLERAAGSSVPVLSHLAGALESGRQAIGRGFVKDFELREAARLETIAPGSVERLLSQRRTLANERGAMAEQFAARGRAIDQGVSAAEQRRMIAFLEIPGAAEEFMASRGVPLPQLRALASPEKLRQLRAVFGTTDEAVDQTIRSFSPTLAGKLERYLTGERDALVRVPGKRGIAGQAENVVTGEFPGIQEDFFTWDHLQVEQAAESLDRLGLAHVGHFSTTHGVRDFERVFAQELTGLMPQLKGLEGEALLRRAESLTSAITGEGAKLKARRIFGTIEQINAYAAARGKAPLFREKLGEIAFGEGQRWLDVRDAKAMYDTILGDPNLSRAYQTAPGPDVLPAGWQTVPVESLSEAARQTLTKAGTPFLAMPKLVAKEIVGPQGFLARFARLERDPNPILEGLRWFNGIYKPWQLSLPATVMRNLIGDLALNASAGVGPTWYPAGKQLFGLVRDALDGKTLPATFTVKGTMFQTRELLDELVHGGLPGQAFWQSEVARLGMDALESGRPRTVAAWFGNGTTTGVPFLGPASRHLQEGTTAVTRLAHYLERRVGQKLAPEAAALSVKKHLYDFDNLTPFEQRVMRQVFPFYSWARQNIPNQLRPETLLGGFGIGEPGKIGVRFTPNVAIAREAVTGRAEHADIPDEMLPTWLQGQLGIPVGRKDGKLSIFALNSWLPVADLSEIDNPKKLVKYVFNQLTPLFGEPVEQLANWDAYFERAIEAYPGEQEFVLGQSTSRRSAKIARVSSFINWLDRALAPLLGLKTGSERLKDGLAQPEWTDLLARTLTGAKVREVDLAEAKRRSLARVAKEIRDLEMRRRFAVRDREANNVAVVDALLKEKRALRETLAVVDPRDVPSLWLLTEPAFADRLRLQGAPANPSRQ